MKSVGYYLGLIASLCLLAGAVHNIGRSQDWRHKAQALLGVLGSLLRC
jgi:hypothetical protein